MEVDRELFYENNQQPIYPQPGMPQYGVPQQQIPAYGQPVYNQSPVSQNVAVNIDPTYSPAVESSSSSSDIKKSIAKATAVREANFLRKVYLILTTQILLTMALTIVGCLVKINSDNLATIMWNQIWPICVAAVLMIVSLIVCLFVYNRVPMNFIFLAIYTVSWSVIVMCIAGPVAGDGSVAAAFIITSIIFVGLTIITCIPKIKQVIWIFILFALAFCAIGGLITYYIWFCAVIGLVDDNSDTLYIIICCICAAVFSCYIVIDSLWARAVDSKFNNYIYAAIRIYTDFVFLLILLIAALGGRK